MFYDIICNLDGSLLDIIFQKNPPANTIFTMYAGEILHMLPIKHKQRKYFYYILIFIILIMFLLPNLHLYFQVFSSEIYTV